jgi:hypothetical protein
MTDTSTNVLSYIPTIFKYKLTRYIINFTCVLLIFLSLCGRLMLDMKLDNSSLIIIFTGFIIIGLTIYYNFLQKYILDVYDYDNKRYILENDENTKDVAISYTIKIGITLIVAIIIFKEFYAFLYTIHMIVNTLIFLIISIMSTIYAWIRMLIDTILLLPSNTMQTGKNITSIFFKPEAVPDSMYKTLKEICDSNPFTKIAYPILKEMITSCIFLISSMIVGVVSVPYVVASNAVKIFKHTLIYLIVIISLIIISLCNILKRVFLVSILSILSIGVDISKMFNIEERLKSIITMQELNDLRYVDFKLVANDIITLDINTMRMNDVKVINKGIEAIDNLLIGGVNNANSNAVSKFFPERFKTIFEESKERINEAKLSILRDTNCGDKKEVENLFEFAQNLKENQEIPEFFAISDKNKNFNGFLYSSEFIEYLHIYKKQNKIDNLGIFHILKFILLIIIQTLVLIIIFMRLIDNNKNKIQEYNRENIYFYHNSVLVMYVIVYILVFMLIINNLYITIKGGYINNVSLNGTMQKHMNSTLPNRMIQFKEMMLEELTTMQNKNTASGILQRIKESKKIFT